MKKNYGVLFAALGFLVVPSSRVSADHCCPSACQPACAPATCLVEKTVMVPQMATETRKICVTECRPETRTRKITVNRLVEERQEVPYEYTVLKRECRTRKITINRLVEEKQEVPYEYTVMKQECRIHRQLRWTWFSTRTAHSVVAIVATCRKC